MLNSCNQTTQETLLIKGNNQVGINEYIDLSAYQYDPFHIHLASPALLYNPACATSF